jgi:hypothetical protein
VSFIAKTEAQMQLISIRHRAEGEMIAIALIAIWYMRVAYDGVDRLRCLGIAIALPAPTFFKYWDLCTGALMRGVRIPVAAFKVDFIRGDKRNRAYRMSAWLRPVGHQTLVATREQIEDGLYPVSSTTKGEANVSAD